tara:strand:+ start:184 stop:690 length:507 start_codon:yes stop_codon:yes gene_type:complete
MGLGYSSDCINRNIVLIVFLTFYMYLSYVSNQLKRSKNWESVKCNPLEMVISGIFDSEASNSHFKKCMQYSVSNEQEKNIQDYSNKLDTELQSSINKLNAGSLNSKNATDVLLNKTEQEINNLKTESIDNETTLNNFKIKIQQLTDKVNASFDTFRDGSNNLLSKLAL